MALVQLARSDNPILNKLSTMSRVNRPVFDNTIKYNHWYADTPYGNYLQMWFLTRGCLWDGCTMCDYGEGPKLTVDEMVDNVRQGIDAIDRPISVFFLSPSGSMLDAQEVPPEARRGMWELVNKTYGVRSVISETRAETVTDTALNDAIEIFDGKNFVVEMGLETANPWIQRFCVNKGSLPSKFSIAAKKARAKGVSATANVSLGTLFLSPQEAIDDAVSTIIWAHENGANYTVLFVLYPKEHSLMGWLYQRGRYQIHSNWSLIEVLNRLPEEIAKKTNLPWYRQQFDDQSMAGPTTCPLCHKHVESELDRLIQTADIGIVKRLSNYDCPCHSAWRESLNIDVAPLHERVAASYDQMALEFKIEDYWQLHRTSILQEMSNEFLPIPSL